MPIEMNYIAMANIASIFMWDFVWQRRIIEYDKPMVGSHKQERSNESIRNGAVV